MLLFIYSHIVAIYHLQGFSPIYSAAIYYGNIKRPLSLSRLGVLLSQKGFLSIRKGNPQRRGWVVYKRDNEEINAERRMLSKT